MEQGDVNPDDVQHRGVPDLWHVRSALIWGTSGYLTAMKSANTV